MEMRLGKLRLEHWVCTFQNRCEVFKNLELGWVAGGWEYPGKE